MKAGSNMELDFGISLTARLSSNEGVRVEKERWTFCSLLLELGCATEYSALKIYGADRVVLKMENCLTVHDSYF